MVYSVLFFTYGIRLPELKFVDNLKEMLYSLVKTTYLHVHVVQAYKEISPYDFFGGYLNLFLEKNQDELNCFVLPM